MVARFSDERTRLTVTTVIMKRIHSRPSVRVKEYSVFQAILE